MVLFFNTKAHCGGIDVKKLIHLFSALMTILIKAAFLIDNLKHRVNFLLNSLLRMPTLA